MIHAVERNEKNASFDVGTALHAVFVIPPEKALDTLWKIYYYNFGRLLSQGRYVMTETTLDRIALPVKLLQRLKKDN